MNMHSRLQVWVERFFHSCHVVNVYTSSLLNWSRMYTHVQYWGGVAQWWASWTRIQMYEVRALRRALMCYVTNVIGQDGHLVWSALGLGYHLGGQPPDDQSQPHVFTTGRICTRDTGNNDYCLTWKTIHDFNGTWWSHTQDRRIFCMVVWVTFHSLLSANNL